MPLATPCAAPAGKTTPRIFSTRAGKSGSRKGTAHKESDIDVAVIFDGFSGDWLKTSSQLWRLTRNVSFDIEPILLDSTNDKSGFVKNIYKTGQIIYSANKN